VIGPAGQGCDAQVGQDDLQGGASAAPGGGGEDGAVVGQDGRRGAEAGDGVGERLDHVVAGHDAVGAAGQQQPGVVVEDVEDSSSIQTFAAAILSSIWAMRWLRNIATVIACSGTLRRLWVVLGSLITSRHCPTAVSPRRDIEPEPLQRGRHVACRRPDTSHARPYHMRARVRRPSNSRS
jgi:hypothetical protein